MEDILSILVVILFAVASVKKKNKKKKAKAPNSKGPVQFAQTSEKGFAEMKEFIKDVGKAVLEMDDDDFTSPARMKPQKMKAKPAQARAIREVPQPAKPTVAPSVNLKKASVIEEGLGAAPVSTQGYSLFEDQGCISGSIPHDAHEGDSQYSYGALKGMDRYDNDSVYADDIARELQSMNVQRLRRAIVVSEILDRPKALRRR